MNQVPSDSLFAELRPPAPFDVQVLEKQFALTQPRPAGSSSAAGGAAVMQRRPSASDETRKRLRILDEKSSQLLAIAFSRLPPPEELATTLRTLQEFPDALPSEGVLSLHTAACEQKEAVAQLKQMDIAAQDLAQLDTPERYLWVLGSVSDSTAKLACGALLVGPARELGDIRKSASRVSTCCKAFRSSELVRRCASTSLAVGNFMNRGTARSNAKAVVLPDSFLKFEELRGAQEAEEEQKSGDSASAVRGPSLLDFVAQALVDEAGAGSALALREQADELRSWALDAKGVSIEEAEASCKQVCKAATAARQGFEPVLRTSAASLAAAALDSAAAALDGKVRRICHEAEDAAALVQTTKADLAATQTWSAAKAGTKGEEWFASWAAFFEQLATALARTRPPRPAPKPQQQQPPAASAVAVRPALGEMAAAPQAPAAAQAPAVTRGAKKSEKVFLDDDARVEDMGALMEMLKSGAAAGPAAAGRAAGAMTARGGSGKPSVGCAGKGKENVSLR